MRRRWLIAATLLGIAAVAGAVLVVAASGSDPASAAEYEAAVVNTRDRADFALASIQEAQSEEEFLDRLDEAGTLIEDAAGDLDDVVAPARFEDESERLVRRLSQLSADLRGTAAQAREAGFEDLLSGAAGLNFASWDAVNAILAQLRKQGVQVEPLGRH